MESCCYGKIYLVKYKKNITFWLKCPNHTANSEFIPDDFERNPEEMHRAMLSPPKILSVNKNSVHRSQRRNLIIELPEYRLPHYSTRRRAAI
jgi:hypothetical protein